MRTQVAIIGAGPAGMFLAHCLSIHGVRSIVIERKTRDYVENRVRAGVLERTTVKVLRQLGLHQRLDRQGLRHSGVKLGVDGEHFRIAFDVLEGDAEVTVYGQQEVMRDLFDAAEARQVEVHWNADDVALHDLDGIAPSVTWSTHGQAQRLDCDFIVGCDGFHGVCRSMIPADLCASYERIYEFGWLGILAEVPPVEDELIYVNHSHGFALASMRSPTRSRYYIQCSLDDRIEDWPDARFWDELCLRLGVSTAARLTRGPSFDKSIAPLRSFVCEPMQYGRLFLAGDAAHIVPPTGAKGMNLAVADASLLAAALRDFYQQGAEENLLGYSRSALARVWKAERFSWWFTSLTHRFPGMDAFGRRMQTAEIDYIRTSAAAQRVFAENYTGLPLGSV